MTTIYDICVVENYMICILTYTLSYSFVILISGHLRKGDLLESECFFDEDIEDEDDVWKY